VFRPRRLPTHTLDLQCFNQVIGIDVDRRLADVEGMTTYEDLVGETRRHGYLPTVVPELKSITVGGALSGVGIESSSFRYGLVHETVTEVDVLLGTGDVITCCPDGPHQELFYGLPNSYGTLGYVLRVQLQIILIKKYVKLTHMKFLDARAYYAKVKEVCLGQRSSGPIAYIDGTLFSENEIYLTLGTFVDNAPFVSNYQYRNIYYRSIQHKQIDYLPTEDYIWRWDADWFWCSKAFFMQHPLVRLLLGKWMLRSTVYWKIRKFFQQSRWLSALYRYVFGPGESIIQDVLIPIDNAPEFFNFFFREINIRPVWNCPMMNHSSRAQYRLFPTDTGTLYVNFGFWAIVSTDKKTPPGYYNRKVEEKVHALGGKKSLYSDVYYPKELFWQIYNHDAYKNLKAAYDPDHVFSDLYTKCVLG